LEAREFLKERCGTFTSDRTYNYSENFIELISRLKETRLFLEELPSKHVVIVSHALFLKALSAYLILGESLNKTLLEDFNDALVIGNASISKCMFNDEKIKWRIMSWNDISHFNE
jgi:broad specificity phosphatase PhoE